MYSGNRPLAKEHPDCGIRVFGPLGKECIPGIGRWQSCLMILHPHKNNVLIGSGLNLPTCLEVVIKKRMRICGWRAYQVCSTQACWLPLMIDNHS